MIPKVIHYCWFGGNPLDDMAKKCIASWKKFCPDYEIKEWNESNFDINCCDYVREAYENKKWAFITDYVRLYVLMHEGGVYMDTDAELIKPIDEFLVHNAFSGFESYDQIPTAIMGAEKNNEWISYLISYYDGRHFVKSDGTLDVTTNVITITDMTKNKYEVELNNTFQAVNNVFTLYPKEYFCPKESATTEIKLTPNTVCIHHFGGSWTDPYRSLNNRQKSKFVEKYGVDIGLKKYDRWRKIHKIDSYIKCYGLRTTVFFAFRKCLKILGVYKNEQK